MREKIKYHLGYLWSGFVFLLPLIILLLIILFLFNNLEGIGRKVLLLLLPDKLVFPGLGIMFGAAMMYLAGRASKNRNIKSRLSRIPVLGIFFGEGEVITTERLAHLTPCLFMISPTCLSYGWILSEEKVRLGDEKAEFILVNVYYPNVPALVTGQVYPLRKDTVIRLRNSSKEIIDLLLYAFRSPQDLKYMPWDDESKETFERRAKAFGLDLAACE